MPGSWTTLTVKDAGGTTRTMRAWDESGAGTGPYSFGQVLGDGLGTALAKAEDAASASGDLGIPAMVVQKATPVDTAADGDYANLQISGGRLWVAANISHGKTIKTASGTLTSDTDVIAAVTSKRIKVIAYSIITTGVNANAAIFKSNGTGGTELWRIILQAPAASSVYGANLAIAAPSFLFATVAGEKLTLDVGNADAIHYSIAYFDDDAT